MFLASVVRKLERYQQDTWMFFVPSLTFVFNIKRTPAAAITITSLDDANLVRHVQGVVVGRQPHVRLLLSVGPEI